MNYYGHFEIDIISALSSQLIKAFERLSVGPLTGETLNGLPAKQGVYQLFHKDRLVYVGKARNLPKRLLDHYRKIGGRKNITVEDMGFKCLSVHPNWTALAPEDTLIRYYKSRDSGDCEWNGNSFGPHDPGRSRETTNKLPQGFDAQYPIKDNWVCGWIGPGPWNGNELLQELKRGLPYLLRYQTSNPNRWREGHPDYNLATIDVLHPNMTARELLKTIAGQLPGWQTTIFPSHMILYKETRDYKHGEVL